MTDKTAELRELAIVLKKRFAPYTPPPCPVCGHARDGIGAIGMGRITYHCGSAEADPMGKGPEFDKAMQHYSDSRLERAISEDEDVVKLADALLERLSAPELREDKPCLASNGPCMEAFSSCRANGYRCMRAPIKVVEYVERLETVLECLSAPAVGEVNRESERRKLVDQVGECCNGADPLCAGGCLVEKALQKLTAPTPPAQGDVELDAARYRWIRSNSYEFSFITDNFDWTGGLADQLDAAIDEALATERKETQ